MEFIEILLNIFYINIVYIFIFNFIYFLIFSMDFFYYFFKYIYKKIVLLYLKFKFYYVILPIFQFKYYWYYLNCWLFQFKLDFSFHFRNRTKAHYYLINKIYFLACIFFSFFYYMVSFVFKIIFFFYKCFKKIYFFLKNIFSSFLLKKKFIFNEMEINFFRCFYNFILVDFSWFKDLINIYFDFVFLPEKFNNFLFHFGIYKYHTFPRLDKFIIVFIYLLRFFFYSFF
jgi:hypothetical protein